MARIAKSAVKFLRSKGKKAGLIRPITLWPFPTDIFKELSRKRKRLTFLAVEMSYGQMVEDVRLALEGKARVEFFGRSGGGIPTGEGIIKKCMRL
jgi:2-oxoglutarate ferredoxin oxidoreductase subunit alpha